MKVLLTGHSGFIGMHVEKGLLDCGFTVHRVSRACGYDLERKTVFAELPDADIIVHLAGAVGVEESWKEPESFLRTNYLVTLSVAEYARKNNSPIVFVSSYMYGNPNYLPIDENHPVSCNNPYAYSKKVSEDLLISYHHLFGIGVKIIRPMNLYGKGMPETNIVGLIFRQVINGNVIRLRDLSPKRDYLHVSDLANAICHVVNRGAIEGLDIYNLGFGSSFSVADIIEEARFLTGQQLEIIETSEKRQNEIHDCYANIKKFSEEFGWTPRIRLREGLRQILADMRERPGHPARVD